MAGRPSEFRQSVKSQARFRQWGHCGLCGNSLDSLYEHAHHVRPVASGGTATVENCVILCDTCHYRAHADGSYRSGIVAPQDYFEYFDGPR